MSRNPFPNITQFFHASTCSSNLASVMGVIGPVVAVISSTSRGNLGENMLVAHLGPLQPLFGASPLTEYDLVTVRLLIHNYPATATALTHHAQGGTRLELRST